MYVCFHQYSFVNTHALSRVLVRVCLEHVCTCMRARACLWLCARACLCLYSAFVHVLCTHTHVHTCTSPPRTTCTHNKKFIEQHLITLQLSVEEAKAYATDNEKFSELRPIVSVISSEQAAILGHVCRHVYVHERVCMSACA